MKKTKRVYIALFGAMLLVAGSVSVWAQTAQQTGDQSKSDSSAAAKSKKKKSDAGASSSKAATDSNTASSEKKSTSKKTETAAPAAGAPASVPASKTAATQHSPPANSAGMVWVNTDSGVYHKPGTRWYGKTKQGKYMLETDAIKSGYRASGKN
jgi:cytoskeletal protein RodZ